ncbi:MAG: hypothetical protein ACKVTZ_01330 [Bacteroidia bacterium]
MRNNILYLGCLGALFCLILAACQEDTPNLPPKNPFDEYDSIPDTPSDSTPSVDAKSFAGIHQTVFRPTCANSGCHDGTFEPDFRTIESSYNTLVLHPIIKNNPQNTFQYRVVPNNVAASQLWERLTHDIDGQSGIMPLAIDPDSDWETKKDEYLANIQAWIAGGAKDMFGNAPQSGNLQPTMKGLVAFASGSSTPLLREGNTGSVLIPAGTNNIDIWFSFADDNAQAQDLQVNQVKFSTLQNDFSNSNANNLQILNPIMQMGYFGTNTDYTHKFTLDISTYSSGALIYARAFVKDPTLSVTTEIPTTGSPSYIKLYFSLKKL